jgi:hypothetical protein
MFACVCLYTYVRVCVCVFVLICVLGMCILENEPFCFHTQSVIARLHACLTNCIPFSETHSTRPLPPTHPQLLHLDSLPRPSLSSFSRGQVPAQPPPRMMASPQTLSPRGFSPGPGMTPARIDLSEFGIRGQQPFASPRPLPPSPPSQTDLPLFTTVNLPISDTQQDSFSIYRSMVQTLPMQGTPSGPPEHARFVNTSHTQHQPRGNSPAHASPYVPPYQRQHTPSSSQRGQAHGNSTSVQYETFCSPFLSPRNQREAQPTDAQRPASKSPAKAALDRFRRMF